MMWICPATGHAVKRRIVSGAVLPADAFCGNHGVPLFRACEKCGEAWTFVSKRTRTGRSHKHGRDYCTACGAPSPWLTREQKMAWIRHQIQAAREIDPATRDELIEVVERLKGMDLGDSKAIPGWEKIKTRAPKLWEVVRPVLVNVVSGEVKKWLGL